MCVQQIMFFHEFIIIFSNEIEHVPIMYFPYLVKIQPFFYQISPYLANILMFFIEWCIYLYTKYVQVRTKLYELTWHENI